MPTWAYVGVCKVIGNAAGNIALMRAAVTYCYVSDMVEDSTVVEKIRGPSLVSRASIFWSWFASTLQRRNGWIE